jgi:3-oxoacyl-[acyl-carrier protein] reductase
VDRLLGRTALVTGAARGLGAQIVRRFAEEGAHVIVNDLNLTAAQDTANKYNGDAFACDVSNSSEVDQMFLDIAARGLEVDILVNNAGISGLEGDNKARERVRNSLKAAEASARGEIPEIDPPILEVTDSSWSKMLAVHLDGTFFCSRAFVKNSRKSNSFTGIARAIINMGSIMGTSGGSGSAAYCAAKAGILGLTRSLARELAPFKIFPLLVAQTPQGRLGEPDDIAWAAVYLGSDEAKFVTGQTLSPNGGWHMSQ